MVNHVNTRIKHSLAGRISEEKFIKYFLEVKANREKVEEWSQDPDARFLFIHQPNPNSMVASLDPPVNAVNKAVYFYKTDAVRGALSGDDFPTVKFQYSRYAKDNYQRI